MSRTREGAQAEHCRACCWTTPLVPPRGQRHQAEDDSGYDNNEERTEVEAEEGPCQEATSSHQRHESWKARVSEALAPGPGALCIVGHPRTLAPDSARDRYLASRPAPDADDGAPSGE